MLNQDPAVVMAAESPRKKVFENRLADVSVGYTQEAKDKFRTERTLSLVIPFL